MPLEGGRTASPPRFRLRLDFIAHSILLTLRKYELLYLDVRSISLAHAVVSLFYLRIKKQRPTKGGRVRSMDSLHYSCLHMIYAVYIAFIKFSVARTFAILLLRANNERFENNLIDRRPVRVHPPTFDLFSKTFAEIILRQRRARFCPDTLSSSLSLSLSLSLTLISGEGLLLFLFVLRLMQSENVDYLFSSFSCFRVVPFSVIFLRGGETFAAFPSERDRSDISREYRQISPDNNTSLLQQFQQSRE